MPHEEPEALGADGIFKLLAWKTRALTRLLGLPDIKGEPIQQEYQFPRERRVDGLYRLEDGSLLNIEHQSSLSGRDDLARRLITYHIMIKQEFPRDPLLQVVIYTGGAPPLPRRLGDAIEYVSLDASGRYGLRYSAALIDFRSKRVDEFRKSGLLDDLILGLMTQGGDDDVYIGEVIARIRQLSGEAKRSSIEKFIAACVTMPDRKAGQIDFGDPKMWTGELKEGTLLRKIVELVGKERIDAAEAEGRVRGEMEGRIQGEMQGRIQGEMQGRLQGEILGKHAGIAHSIVRYALKHKIDLPSSPEALEAALAAQADEPTLDAMLDDIETMTDFNAFAQRHGVLLAGAKR